MHGNISYSLHSLFEFTPNSEIWIFLFFLSLLNIYVSYFDGKRLGKVLVW